MIFLDVIINYRSRMQSRVCAHAMRKLRHSSLEPSPKLPYYMKFSRHIDSDANNKCRKHNMARKLSDSHDVHNKERTSSLPLKRLQNHIFYFLRNFQCKWMLWSIKQRIIIHVQT